ncbi:titin-like isoform X4 [Penaeus japonicus]|uniref:titin-like isoform X4 n=1 Tax=Penaeus japonicus TaxID=27405 RepID=UPI001C712632|nr:titin-like isoform X4 [Penaeus japonicus]
MGTRNLPPKAWMLGSDLTEKTGTEEAEVNLETCVPLPEEESGAPLSLTAFKGELDSAVTQYLTQVKDLGYKEESRDQKLLQVKFKLDPHEIKPKIKEEVKDTKPRVKVISREDKGEQTELEVELPSLDNPLYLTLSECSSGELPLEHFYENGQITDDEHIYENVENSTGDEYEEHLYDTLPRHKPDLPPKPDFLAQLAARQSEPVKRAWNPFVSLSVETGDPTPPLSTASSLSSPDSHASSDRLEVHSPRRNTGNTNPFLPTAPRETSEQTLILDGSETSDLGSSGGEEDIGSVEDWPLPPTPPPGEDAVIVEDHPLPPPPPELALQELEEEVIREEEEERKLALQKEKEAIERDYGGIRFHDSDFREEEADKVEAVNANIALLERNFEDTSDSEPTPKKESNTERERKLTFSREAQPEVKTEAKRELRKETEREYRKETKTEVKKDSANERKFKKETKVVQLDDESEEFDTPAIRHSVIIELKDSCPTVPQSLKPSEIRRKESLKRSESLKRTGILERIESQRKLERRESFCKLFPKISTSLQPKAEDHGSSVSVGVKSPKKEDQAFTFLNVPSSAADQVIEISEDGSWEMKETSMDSEAAAQSNPDVDPFTGNPIMAPPLSPPAIAAPPLAFQTDDGMDGVYSANIVSTYSGPSSLASASTDSLGPLASLQADAPVLLTTPETILEEILPAPRIEVKAEVEAKQQSPSKKSQEESQSAKNLGAAIMKGYEQDLQKKKDSMNLPEHSLLEFGDTVRDLEEQRRSVIKQMTVKAKRKDTWIKTFHMHAQGNEESIPVAPSRSRRKSSPSRDALEAGKVTQFAKKVDEIEKETFVKTSPVKEELSREEPAVPPKAPEKRKKGPKKPEDIPRAPEVLSNDSVCEESVISPKNTEALAAFFASPAKTPKAMEPTSSPKESPKKSQAKPDLIDETDSTTEGQATVTQEEIAPPNPEATTYIPEATLEAAEATVEATEEPIALVQPSKALSAPEASVVEEEEQQQQPEEEQEEHEEQDSMVKEKNEINRAHSTFPNEDTARAAEEIPEQKEGVEDVAAPAPAPAPTADYTMAVPLAPQSTHATDAEDKGNRGVCLATSADPDHPTPREVEYFSILDNKVATKTYWENRMLATMDDGGWESVANVRFQVPGVTSVVQEEESPRTVTPPLEFIPAPPPQFDNSPAESEESNPPSLEAPAKLKGAPEKEEQEEEEERPAKQYVYGVSETGPKNLRPARIVETVAKRPPTQENVIEAEIRAQQQKEEDLRREGCIKNGVVREKGASSPASHDSDEGFVDRLAEDVTTTPTNGFTHTLPGNDGEPVIYDAVSPPPEYFGSSTPTPSNTTETKIALEIRELREREDELRRMRDMSTSRENFLDDDEVRSSASRDQLLEDHLTSLTTTTDEGNFSECGDPASSEDKSSDGSNSRIMSPELMHPGTHLDFGRRKVTVKPFEDEEEDQPVYTRMQKESVIEREIRLAREREEAYRREKGLTNSAPSSSAGAPSRPAAQPAVARPSPVVTDPRRGVQHRLATNRIQQEIQETSQKEKELRDAGKILTMSEETVDAKVTRMSDFTEVSESPRLRPSTSSRPAGFSTPVTKRSPSPRSPSSPVPNFTPSPSRGLTKSLSTTNLASPTASATMRAPKGLMQKFIASRGKMTTSAFSSPPPALTHVASTSRGVPTRPMRVEPKTAVVQRETLARMRTEPSEVPEEPLRQQNNQVYRRTHCTAEEKIQSELKEMQMREEELRRLRARQLAQSQPNLAGLGIDDADEVDSQDRAHMYAHEINGLRSVLSNPNLLEDEPEQTQASDKTVRRRSALIAQWENRIQQTSDT